LPESKNYLYEVKLIGRSQFAKDKQLLQTGFHKQHLKPTKAQKQAFLLENLSTPAGGDLHPLAGAAQ
jgi:hypothetical protein